MSATKSRRTTLRKLLVTGAAASQAELCDLLEQRGHRATQSTISRDLRLLGAQRRVGPDGALVYLLPTSANSSFPSQMVTGVEHNEVHIVVRTRVGRAPAVGIELDNLRLPGLLATISGDDTVLVIPRSVGNTAALADQLRELAGLPPAVLPLS